MKTLREDWIGDRRYEKTVRGGVMSKDRVLIAMSGGVDSSVAALLMKQKGYDCIGITMRLFDNDDIGKCSERTCCSAEDTEDARQVAERVGIPYYVYNFTGRFRENVIERFVDAYEHGRTPNPCIDCNRYMKFGALFEKAKDLSCGTVVTGHYARIGYDETRGRYLLRKGQDPEKDQSYVLYQMTQEQLAHVQFPLGEMTKEETRALAAEAGLENASKHESQDICFVPDGKYADFIEHFRGQVYPPGDFMDREGNVLGQHKGVIRYTIGQRKGLGIALQKPAYVCGIDPVQNTVTLGSSEDLFTTELTAAEVNLIAVDRIDTPMEVTARVRYHQKEQPATVIQIAKDRIRLTFHEAQRAITPGQAVVMYQGDVVIGGGVIE